MFQATSGSRTDYGFGLLWVSDLFFKKTFLFCWVCVCASTYFDFDFGSEFCIDLNLH